MTKNVAVAPNTRPEMYKMMCDAVKRSGATLTGVEDAEGLIWADPARPELFPEIAEKAASLQWIQLPYAGIEPFANNLDPKWRWTCGKGVYAPAVAETTIAGSTPMNVLNTYFDRPSEPNAHNAVMITWGMPMMRAPMIGRIPAFEVNCSARASLSA